MINVWMSYIQNRGNEVYLYNPNIIFDTPKSLKSTLLIDLIVKAITKLHDSSKSINTRKRNRNNCRYTSCRVWLKTKIE